MLLYQSRNSWDYKRQVPEISRQYDISFDLGNSRVDAQETPGGMTNINQDWTKLKSAISALLISFYYQSEYCGHSTRPIVSND